MTNGLLELMKNTDADMEMSHDADRIYGDDYAPAHSSGLELLERYQKILAAPVHGIRTAPLIMPHSNGHHNGNGKKDLHELLIKNGLGKEVAYAKNEKELEGLVGKYISAVVAQNAASIALCFGTKEGQHYFAGLYSSEVEQGVEGKLDAELLKSGMTRVGVAHASSKMRDRNNALVAMVGETLKAGKLPAFIFSRRLANGRYVLVRYSGNSS